MNSVGSLIASFGLNPFVASSGCCSYGEQLISSGADRQFSVITTKSITLHESRGRPSPRICEAPASLLNAIGLQGVGVYRFVQDVIPRLAAANVSYAVSIAGSSPGEFAKVAAQIRRFSRPAYIELNLSCPNVDDRTSIFAYSSSRAASVVAAVAQEIQDDIPIFPKLSWVTSDLSSIVGACIREGASGVSLINTMLGANVSPSTLRPMLPGWFGGVSGPAIFPFAIKAVLEVRDAFPDLPIVGGGGVSSGIAAAQMISAGADLVSLGTALLQNPYSATEFRRELELFLADREMTISQLKNFAHH